MAETHQVFFVGNGFFPAVIYAKDGDTLQITSNSPDLTTLTVKGLVVVEEDATGAPPPDPATCGLPAWLDSYPVLKLLVTAWLAFHPDYQDKICKLEKDPEIKLETGDVAVVTIVKNGDLILTANKPDGTEIDTPALVETEDPAPLGNN